MSFFYESQPKNFPPYEWMEKASQILDDLINFIYLAENGDFVTPEIKITSQKLREARYWLANSNCEVKQVVDFRELWSVNIKKGKKDDK